MAADEEFEQIAAGQWTQPVRRGYRMKCCDCGLVHVINFRLVKWRKGHKIQLQAFREATQALSSAEGSGGDKDPLPREEEDK